MSLRPCPACRRHVASAASTCVFCAAALPPAAGARPELPGRFARAAVFAGATLASACGAPQPGPAGRVTEPPPVDAAAGLLAPADSAAGPLAAVVSPVDAGVPVLPPVDAAPPVAVIGHLDAGAPLAPQAAPRAPTPVGTGVIQGVLQVVGTKQGVGPVRIQLTGPGAPQDTTTDVAGRFSFAGLARGMWTVTYDNTEVIGLSVERRVRIGRGSRPVSIRLTFKGLPAAARATRVHQAMPYGAPPARRRVV